MPSLNMHGLSTSVAIVLIMLLQGCAGTGNDESRKSSRRLTCEPGETMVCDTRNSGRISDGRYGRRGRDGRVDSCGCVPNRDMEALEGATLPADIN